MDDLRGVRGELAEVQLALETAQGAAVRPLLVAEEKLFAQHAEELLGPFAERPYRYALSCRRWFVDRIEMPRVPADALLTAFDKLQALLDHPSGSRCRSLVDARFPRRVPHSVEELMTGQTVVTERMLALPGLRAIHAHAPVAIAPLQSRTLRHLGMRCMEPVEPALASAELPELETLSLHQVGERPVDAACLVAALSRMSARRLVLSIYSRPYPKMPTPGWTDDDVLALAPVADRISQLSLSAPFLSVRSVIPKVDRLRVEIPTHAQGLADFDRLPLAEKVDLRADALNPQHLSIVDAFVQSDLARSARVLHVSAIDEAFARVADAELPLLEELSVRLARPRPGSVLFAKDHIPNVKTVTVDSHKALDDLAASPLANRIETLVVRLQVGDSSASRWFAVRDRFPRLRTLVVRGHRGLSLDAKASLYERGHDVVWPEPDRLGLRHLVDGVGSHLGHIGE
jgi:hypothetical protein